MNQFYIQLMLTDKCNKSCLYCDLDHKNHTQKNEVDLDYLNWILKILSLYCDDNLYIEITGGEIGLLSNLGEVIQILTSYKCVNKIQLMSNGLVRKDYPDIVPLVDYYNEHLIYELDDKSIISFYDLPFLYKDNIKNVIVLTENTTLSLLDNFEYYDQMGFFNDDFFWLKMYVERTTKIQHRNEIIQLFTKINTSYANYCITQLTEQDKSKKRMCWMYPWQPVIDLQERKIIHCAYHNFTNELVFDCNESNIELLINNKLFRCISMPQYCEDCYLYNRDDRFNLTNKKSNMVVI